MARTKIIIAGGGILGLSCGYEIARRGHPVQVIEAATIGAGSSGGHVGALAPHAPDTWNPKKQTQLAALITASDWWADVARIGGQDPGYGRTGRIQPIAIGAQDPIARRVAGAQANWPEWAKMHITDQPQATLVPDSPSGLWLIDHLTARINPRRALAALAAAIEALGGTITLGQPAEQATIWATGVHGLAPFGGTGVKGQSALLLVSLPDQPQVFADGVHIVPHQDGTVAIGSTSERDRTDTATDSQLDDLIARAQIICPALTGAPVIDRWAGIRPRAKSRAPMVGHYPGRPGQYIANGGFKIGFGMAPAIATMLADLILDDANHIPDTFLPPPIQDQP